MTTIDGLRDILKETLQLGKRADDLDESTMLLGGIPEFDSVAVVTVVTSIEDRFGIMIEDDEITADTFETMGSLREFVDTKLSA